MADTPGEGWWQAQDGEWYPPESHPSRRNDDHAVAWRAAQPVPSDEPAAAGPPAGPGPGRPGRPGRLRALRRSPISLCVAGIVVLGAAAGALALADHSAPRSPAGVGLARHTSTSTTPPVGSTSTPTVGATTRSGSASTLGANAPPLPVVTPTTSPPPVITPVGTTTTLPSPSTTTGGVSSFSAPFSGSGPAGNLVTATTEHQVVATTWAGFLKAEAQNDLAKLADYTTTAGQRTVDGYLYCGCTPWAPNFASVGYSAPVQASYPVSFLAQFRARDYAQQTSTELVIFTQASAGSPWLVNYLGSYVGGPLIGTSAHITSPSPAEPTLASAPQDLASFFQTLDATGKSPAPLPTGYEADGLLRSLATASKTAYVDRATNGTRRTISHSIVQVSPAFALTPAAGATGPALECFTMSFDETVQGSATDPLAQTTVRGEWTAMLAPGTYSEIHKDEYFSACVDQFAGTGPRLLLTNYGGAYSVTGTTVTRTAQP